MLSSSGRNEILLASSRSLWQKDNNNLHQQKYILDGGAAFPLKKARQVRIAATVKTFLFTVKPTMPALIGAITLKVAVANENINYHVKGCVHRASSAAAMVALCSLRCRIINKRYHFLDNRTPCALRRAANLSCRSSLITSETSYKFSYKLLQMHLVIGIWERT